MSRIQPVDPRTAVGEARQLLDAVHSGLGVTPNFTRVLAHSPAALAGFGESTQLDIDFPIVPLLKAAA